MKKTYILLTILALFLGITATYALNKVNTDITLPAGSVTNLQNPLINKSNYGILKVVDGKNTCYVTYYDGQTDKSIGNISCVN